MGVLMENWFGLRSEYNFEIFSSSHWAVLVTAFLGFIVMFGTYKKWPDHPVIYQTVKWLFFSLLLFSELSYQLWTNIHGIWSFKFHVPLHLCGIASLLAMLAIILEKRILIQVCFFFGVIPALLALFTPDLPYDFQHYRFWKFFIHHTVISWTCTFLALSKPYLITFRSLLKSYSLLLIYALIMGVFVNPMTGANYLYLTAPPNRDTLLDIFGSGYLYYFNLCLTAFVLFFLQYGLWKWLVVKKKSRQVSN